MAHPHEIVAPTTVNDCTSATDWEAIAGTLTVSEPPSDRYGTTRKLLLTSEVNTAAYMDLTLDQTLSGRLAFLIYLDEFDSGYGSGQNTKTMTIYCGNDADMVTNFYSKTFTVRHGWQLLVFSRQDQIASSNEECGWAKDGSPSWDSAMVRIRVRIEAVAGTATRMYLCNISDGGYYKPQVIIDFDDNLASAYSTAFPIMEALNIKGTMNVISSKVGVSGYCTEEELQEMYDAGWDMSNHTKSHVQNSYYGGTYAYCLSEIVDCQNYLKAKGWTRRNCHLHFAAPYGEATYREASAYRQAIVDAGCLTGRSTIERVSSPFSIDPVHANCILPDGVAPETAQNQIDRIKTAIGYGGVVRLLFHDIVTPANTQIKWTPTNFQTIMNQLYVWREGGLIDIPTLSQWYQQVKDHTPI